MSQASAVQSLDVSELPVRPVPPVSTPAVINVPESPEAASLNSLHPGTIAPTAADVPRNTRPSQGTQRLDASTASTAVEHVHNIQASPESVNSVKSQAKTASQTAPQSTSQTTGSARTGSAVAATPKRIQPSEGAGRAPKESVHIPETPPDNVDGTYNEDASVLALESPDSSVCPGTILDSASPDLGDGSERKAHRVRNESKTTRAGTRASGSRVNESGDVLGAWDALCWCHCARQWYVCMFVG